MHAGVYVYMCMRMCMYISRLFPVFLLLLLPVSGGSPPLGLAAPQVLELLLAGDGEGVNTEEGADAVDDEVGPAEVDDEGEEEVGE